MKLVNKLAGIYHARTVGKNQIYSLLSQSHFGETSEFSKIAYLMVMVAICLTDC